MNSQYNLLKLLLLARFGLWTNGALTQMCSYIRISLNKLLDDTVNNKIIFLQVKLQLFILELINNIRGRLEIRISQGAALVTRLVQTYMVTIIFFVQCLEQWNISLSINCSLFSVWSSVRVYIYRLYHLFDIRKTLQHPQCSFKHFWTSNVCLNGNEFIRTWCKVFI